MFETFQKLLGMIRFSHTIFALPFALMAGTMAWSATAPPGHEVSFRWLDLIGILVCMVGARSAAMAFNRWADRHIDARNPRTANRHLPAGHLSSTTVIVFTILSIAIFILGTCLFLPNWLPLAVSIPVLAVLLGYSYAKRFTALAHYWLGVALMLAPICAWLAVRGLIVWEFPLDLTPALLLGMAVLFWVGGFDIIYACQDYEFDRSDQLNSLPVWLGVAGALRLAAVSHAAMWICLAAMPWIGAWAGPQFGFGYVYWLTLIAVGGLLIYQHWLVRPDDLSRVNQAFFQVNSIISVALLAATLIEVWV